MDKLVQAVSAILDTLPGCDRQSDGTFSCEIYTVYEMCGGVKAIHAPVKLSA